MLLRTAHSLAQPSVFNTHLSDRPQIWRAWKACWHKSGWCSGFKSHPVRFPRDVFLGRHPNVSVTFLFDARRGWSRLCVEDRLCPLSCLRPWNHFPSGMGPGSCANRPARRAYQFDEREMRASWQADLPQMLLRQVAPHGQPCRILCGSISWLCAGALGLYCRRNACVSFAWECLSLER